MRERHRGWLELGRVGARRVRPGGAATRSPVDHGADRDGRGRHGARGRVSSTCSRPTPTPRPSGSLTELTLALILFADASTIDLRQAEGDLGLPPRLLGIGLPLTIALGALAAHVVFPSMSWADAGARRRHPGPDRRRARAGGGDQPGGAGPHPPGAQHRERAQRRDRHPVRDRAARRGGRRPGPRGLGHGRAPRARPRRPDRRRRRVRRGLARPSGPGRVLEHADVGRAHGSRAWPCSPTGGGELLGQRLRLRLRRRAGLRGRHPPATGASRPSSPTPSASSRRSWCGSSSVPRSSGRSCAAASTSGRSSTR